MAAAGSTRKASLTPPMPKDPPVYPDMYGKRRELSIVQMLEREIGFLEEDLEFVEGLHPASQPCKEIVNFVTANSDPLIPTTTRDHKPWHFWRWLCGSPCLKISWPCCMGHAHQDSQRCYNCNRCGSRSCISCSRPVCSCCSSEASRCRIMPSCSSRRCAGEGSPFSNCLCKGPITCYHKCLSVDLCSCCKRYSCYRCCICY